MQAKAQRDEMRVKANRFQAESRSLATTIAALDTRTEDIWKDVGSLKSENQNAFRTRERLQKELDQLKQSLSEYEVEKHNVRCSVQSNFMISTFSALARVRKNIS